MKEVVSWYMDDASLADSRSIWDVLAVFQSEPVTRDYLLHTYQLHMGRSAAHRYSFENTTKFIYYVSLGESYFDAAHVSKFVTQPLSLFYGIGCLLKALLLTKDPAYPHSTSVLQHGLTTRKKKKKHYRFHEDEIKIQKDGFVPHFARSYLKLRLTIHEKLTVAQLLQNFPHLQPPIRVRRVSSQRDQVNQQTSPNPQPETGLHPLLSHYMTAYILSMLSRYDIEAWGNIWFTFETEDAHLIRQYMHFAVHDFPILFLTEMQKMHTEVQPDM